MFCPVLTYGFSYPNYIWFNLNWKALHFLCTYQRIERGGPPHLHTCMELKGKGHSSFLWGIIQVDRSHQVLICLKKKREKEKPQLEYVIWCRVRSSNKGFQHINFKIVIFLLIFNTCNSIQPASFPWSQWRCKLGWPDSSFTAHMHFAFRV